MTQISRSTSFSWWRDSHNSRRQSTWLQNTLRDLDEKSQAMLKLVEAEADSFAQRAEIFYQKRPELVNMIEEFYRAYRSLAEQYDQLKGEIRQSIPKAVQVQYRLSCEVPLESPFRKHISTNKNVNQGFRKILRRHDRFDSDSEVSEVDDPIEPQNYKARCRRCDQESMSALSSDHECVSTISYSDCEVDSPVREATETENVTSRMREMQVKILDLQEENSMLLKQLTAKNIHAKHLKVEINKLKKEKSFCKEEMSLVVRDRSVLQTELDILKTENTKMRNVNDVKAQQLQVLTEKLSTLQKENKMQFKQNKTTSAVLGFVNGQAGRFSRSSARLQNEMCGVSKMEGTMQHPKIEKKKVEVILEGKENLVLEQNLRMDELQGEVCPLVEESWKQELDIIKAENTKLRNENDVNVQKLQVLTEKLSNLQKDSTKLSKQNKIMSAVLGFVNGQATSLARSNFRLRDEMCASNPSEGALQTLKDEQQNVQISLKAKDKLISEQNLRIEELQREFCRLVKETRQQGLDTVKAENTNPRNENEVNVQKLQVLSENVSDLLKETTNLRKQNKIMSAILGFISGQAISLARSNARLRNEMLKSNHQQREVSVGALKDEEGNLENIFKTKEKLLSEQISRIEELQSTVSRLGEENRLQQLQLLDRNEEKREAIRQLCFTLDALRDKNKRLQEALQKSRRGEEGESKLYNKCFSSAQVSRWKRFLFTVLDGGSRPLAL